MIRPLVVSAARWCVFRIAVWYFAVELVVRLAKR
jgi:hypothetical protein